jgi:hypothetical protein
MKHCFDDLWTSIRSMLFLITQEKEGVLKSQRVDKSRIYIPIHDHDRETHIIIRACIL